MQCAVAREELLRGAFLNALFPVDTDARELHRLQRDRDAVTSLIAQKRKASRRCENLSVPELGGHPISLNIRWEACFAYRVSNGCALLATCYFRQRCSPDMQLALDSVKKERIEALLLGWNEKVPREVQTSWRYPRNPSEQRARQRVHDFVAELELWSWVQRMNSQHGYTPSSGHMLERHVEAWPWKSTPNVDNAAYLISASGAAKQRDWARNFRRRWGMTWARLPVHDMDPSAVMQRKAFFNLPH